MNRTKYIIQRIEQIELKMSRRLKLNHPVKKKNKWLRNILMDIHREDEMELINQYYNSLNDDELIAMYVAIKVLESSFDIKKSQGYLKWKSKKQ